MIIGEDFPKIEFEIFGLELVEPNAFIGDFILFLVGMLIASKIKRIGLDHPYFVNWKRFFRVFSFSFLFGGIGHTFFNYLDVPGKYPGWICSIIAIYFLEKALIEVHYNKNFIRIFRKVSKIKLGIFLAAEVGMFIFGNLQSDPQKGLIFPAIASAIGLIFALGILALKHSRVTHRSFKYLFISLFVMVPSAVAQGLKISFSPWFDRNDISHIALIISMLLYWKAIKGFAVYQEKEDCKTSR